MKNFDFEAGRRFREEGDIAEALRCFQSALEEDRENVETYVELALTYIVAFEESGDPLCLDSARKVCLSGLRREPSEAQRSRLLGLQDKVDELLVESEKAEADATADAMEEALKAEEPAYIEEPLAGEIIGEVGEDDDLLDDEEDDPREERGH
jgi:tetratricopeptide (TPR) repeat protein